MQRNMQDYGDISNRYRGFSETGGFSPQDLASIRSRAVSPIRSIYSGANREIDRSKRLGGGYAPGMGAVKSRMAREQSQAVSDAGTNAEAAIAQMVQQGKQFGAQGATSLYGTTPGMASTFGNQVLQSSNQLGNVQQLQNQLGLGRMGAQIQAGQLPGTWETNMNRIKDVGGIAKDVIFPWL